MTTVEMPKVTRRRFTVDEYHRMAEIGVLLEDERVELIEGEILRMSAKGSRHNACINRLTALLANRLGDTAILSVQNSIRTDEYSEPEPDVAVLRPREDYYETALPSPADVLLLIEVAETSLAYDHGLKLPLYGRAGIPEVWIVDLTNEVIEQYIDPADGAYRSIHHAARGQTLTFAALPSLSIPVDAVFG